MVTQTEIRRLTEQRKELDKEISKQRQLLQERQRVKEDVKTLSKLQEELSPTRFQKFKKLLGKTERGLIKAGTEGIKITEASIKQAQRIRGQLKAEKQFAQAKKTKQLRKTT